MALKTATLNNATGAELAASTEINPRSRTDQRYLRVSVATTRHTSDELWKFYNRIGEVHYGISRSARIAGYARLRCVIRDQQGKITEEVTSGLPAEIVRNIQSPYGGVRGLIDRYYTLMKVPGDSYLIRLRDSQGAPDGYHFLSANELDVSSFSGFRPANGRLRWVTVPKNAEGGDNDRFTRPIRADDMIGRIWSPSRQYVDLTESALAAMSDECEQLIMLTESVKGKLLSRFALAGLMFIPNGLSTARVRRSGATVAGQQIDDVLQFLITAMTKNVRSWDDATAYLPIMLRGAPELGEKIQHIVMDREVFETDIALRAELIQRILTGLDANQDMTKGTGGQSHWGAWAAADEERRIAVQPDLETMCWALTRLVLHAELKQAGFSDEQILRHEVWYDLSESTVRANQQEDARQLRDRGLISDEATRLLSGVKEEYAITPDEYVRWVGAQTRNPVLMLHGLDVADDIDWGLVQSFPGGRGPTADSPADDSEAGPGEGDPGSPSDRETDVPRTQRPA